MTIYQSYCCIRLNKMDGVHKIKLSKMQCFVWFVLSFAFCFLVNIPTFFRNCNSSQQFKNMKIVLVILTRICLQLLSKILTRNWEQ